MKAEEELKKELFTLLGINDIKKYILYLVSLQFSLQFVTIMLLLFSLVNTRL